MQTAINPALAAALTLEQAAQVGEFQPVTRDGQPTVAAQLMQKAAPPAIPQVAQQAGLGAQIQNMQMQEAQQELMNRLMQQQQSAGIESLNPNIQGFAEGGIVGYAGGGMTNPLVALLERISLPTRSGSTANVREMREREKDLLAEDQLAEEARRFSQDVPYGSVNAPVASGPTAPSATGIAQALPQRTAAAPQARPVSGLSSSSKEDIDAMMRAHKELTQLPKTADPDEAAGRAMRERAVAEEYARKTGNDPEMVLNQIRQYEDLYRRRDEQLARRMEELNKGKQEQGLIEFLLGAQGFKGEGIGRSLATGARASRAFEAQTKGQMEKIEDLRMELDAVKMDRVNNLRKLKYDTDMGYLTEARKSQQRDVDLSRQEKALEIELRKAVAEIRSQEARTQATISESAATRAEGRRAGLEQKLADQLRMNMANYNKVADDIKDRYKADPAITAYSGMQMSGKGVPPAIENAYRNAIARRDAEIASQTADVRREIERLQGLLYGPGAVKQPTTSSAPMYASNPKTGERIMSNDGGKTWQAAR